MADELVVPQPGFRVDGLADGAEDLERRQVVLVGEGLPELHQGSDGGRRGVELADLVLLDDLPEPVVGRVERRALEDDRGRAVQQWSVRHVCVAGDPTCEPDRTVGCNKTRRGARPFQII